MFANCWQVLVSFLYVQVNALLTAFFVGEEWSRFAYATQAPSLDSVTPLLSPEQKEQSESPAPAIQALWSWRLFTRLKHIFTSDPASLRIKKPLRVSAPRGIQRSTYFISMPWRYGVPLISSISVLHWLISQSIFTIGIVYYESPIHYGEPTNRIYANGFSVEPIIFGKYRAVIFYISSLTVIRSNRIGLLFNCHYIYAGLFPILSDSYSFGIIL